jgi:hypothetical protein
LREVGARAVARVILGFVLAPHAGVPILLVSACSDSASFLRCIADSGDVFLFLAWLAALCGYPFAVLVGIPAFVVLRRHGLLRPIPLAVAGIAIAFCAAGLFFFVEEKFSLAGMVNWIPFSIRLGVPLAGAVAGLAFWAIAVAGNRAVGAGQAP